ncbi:hypothetical protein [Effusibacillus dendaii]
MIVNDAMFVLCAIDQAVRTHLVNESGRTARVTVDIVDRPVREYVMLRSGVGHMSLDIGFGLRTIEVRQFALQVDTLADRGVSLKGETILQLALSYKNERHRALRIHPEVKQKAYFFQHLSVEQMSFIHHNNRLEPVDAAHELNLSMQLALGVTSVEFLFASKLFE